MAQMPWICRRIYYKINGSLSCKACYNIPPSRTTVIIFFWRWMGEWMGMDYIRRMGLAISNWLDGNKGSS